MEAKQAWQDEKIYLFLGPRDGEVIRRGDGDQVFSDCIGFYFKDDDHRFHAHVYIISDRKTEDDLPIYDYIGTDPWNNDGYSPEPEPEPAPEPEPVLV